MIQAILLTAFLSAKPAPVSIPVVQCLPGQHDTTAGMPLDCEARLDSLSKEVMILYKILSGKGIDFARERRKLSMSDSVFNIPQDLGFVLGPQLAKHTLTIFTDPQCPYCQRIYPQLDIWLASHPDLRVGVHLYPLSFHERAMPAARAYWAAARQARFPAFFHKLHVNPTSDLSDSGLVKAASAAGLDLKKFRADWESDASQAAVQQDMALGGRIGVEGTPALYVDGKATQNPDAEFANFK